MKETSDTSMEINHTDVHFYSTHSYFLVIHITSMTSIKSVMLKQSHKNLLANSSFKSSSLVFK